MSRSDFIETLDRLADEGRTVRLWLRDDDAIEPTDPLSRLLDQSAGWQVPMTLAVIPAHATTALADLLRERQEITVATHGWDHGNYASPTEKKQELGLHRGQKLVLSTLDQGLRRTVELFGERAVPMLVPPWNRIAPDLITDLSGLGYKALSVFGREKTAPLPLFNTHVDIIDWKGGKRGRSSNDLYADTAAYLRADTAMHPVLGMLTHHLVHDTAAWNFLDDFFDLSVQHPVCRWISVRDLMDTN